MLTSGRKMSSARRERPIRMPTVTPDDGREREAGAEPDHGVERVMRQDAVER